MRYFHIGFTLGTQPGDVEMKTFLAQQPDWMRYATNCWIVYTAENQMALTVKINTMKPDAEFIILEINAASRWGWHRPMHWDWLDGKPEQRKTPPKLLPR